MNEYTYDPQNRVATATTKKADDTLLYSVDYDYDLVGNRLRIAESSLQADNATTVTRELDYAYDHRYQLTNEKWDSNDDDVTDAEYVYTCDLAGKGLPAVERVDARNQGVVEGARGGSSGSGPRVDAAHT